jgi:multidrug resistance efflux pump
MNRRNVLLGLVLVAMVALVFAIVQRSLAQPPANRILVSGDVRAVVRTVAAPALTYPSISFNVQVPSNPGPTDHVATFSQSSVTGTSTSPASSRSAGSPALSGMLTAVNVQVGDHVTTGEVVAQLDTKMLDLGVEAAKISAIKTKTSVRVLDNGIDTIEDNQDKLVTAKAQLATGKAQLAAARVKLAKGKALLLKNKALLLSAKKNRPALEAQLAVLEAQAVASPPGDQANIAKLKAILAKMPTMPAIRAGLKAIAAAGVKLAAGEVQLATGAAKLAAGEAKLATAADALRKAKKQAIKARDYVRILARATDAAVVLAQDRRDQATIVSPVSGTVTQAAVKGAVAMVGAPLFRIAPDDPPLVDTYVSGDQLGKVHMGTAADITFDSGSGKVAHGTLQTIASSAQYPPTGFPTDIVHMTRTVKLTFRIDSGEAPPVGTPVDIAIHTD